jgi:hypothetical protein
MSLASTIVCTREILISILLPNHSIKPGSSSISEIRNLVMVSPEAGMGKDRKSKIQGETSFRLQEEESGSPVSGRLAIKES